MDPEQDRINRLEQMAQHQAMKAAHKLIRNRKARRRQQREARRRNRKQ